MRCDERICCGNCSHGVFLRNGFFPGDTYYKCTITGKKVKDERGVSKRCGAFTCGAPKKSYCIQCDLRKKGERNED